ncbi:unnamed protein product [Lampetra planeri]
MAEEETEGRPPEHKRSRKPARPLKREINEEMKSFAENTMNELLGWYGYDKVELRDAENLETGETPQHVLKGMGNTDDQLVAPSVYCPVCNAQNGLTEPSGAASSSSPGSLHPAPRIPSPLMKTPADEDSANLQILCAWCQKVGVKRYSLNMGSELKSFCSEKCFAACRRAYFKRNKAKGDHGLGGKFPPLLFFAQDSSRPVSRTNIDVLVCDWCKHIRHTKEYLDFGAGERRLQFCSAKCLNQYKMDIFYKETQAALPAALCNPGPGGEGPTECGGGLQLLTPESWGTQLTDLRRKAPSPGGPPPCSSAATSTSDAACSLTSSSARIPTPRPHENLTLPPPPMSALHPAVGLPPFPPVNMMPNGPLPLPPLMNFSMPSLAPLVPPPTLLVPYPVIVPLPVPIPIPIPIPFDSKQSRDQPEDVSPSSSALGSTGPQSPGSSGEDGGDQNQKAELGFVEQSGSALVDPTVKAEEMWGHMGLPRGQMDGVVDLTVGHKPPSPQELLPAVHIKVEAKIESGSSPSLELGREEKVGAETSAPTNNDSSCNRDHPPEMPPPTSPTGSRSFTVNGWRSLDPPSAASPDRRDGHELEQEAVKENNCSSADSERVMRRSLVKAPLTDADDGLEEGEHGYALPLLSAGGCVLIQPVQKPSDRTAILSCSISAPLSAAGSNELQPPLKRRCLRIRNQNK